MKKEITVKIGFDPRCPKEQKKKPLKIIVTYNRRTRSYAIGETILLTNEQFGNKNCKAHKEAMENAAPALMAAKKVVKEMQHEFESAASNLNPVFAKFKERYHNEYFGKRGQDMTLFSSVADEYISNRLTVAKTKSDYRTSANWMTRFSPKMPIESLTDEDVVRFVKYMKAEHQKKEGKEISENTVRKQLRQLKAIYNYAIEKGYANGSNPFNPTSSQPHTSIRRNNVALNEEEINKFCSYEPENDLQEFALDFFVLLLHASGCNIGDLLLLKNSNVNGDTVTYNRAKTKKTGIDTTFQLTDVSRAIFSKYGCLNPSKPNDYILPYMSGNSGEKNMQYRKDNIRDKINDGLAEICAKLNIPKVTTATMRHTFATIAMNEGTPIGVIQQLLGHANSNTTQIYIDGISNANVEKSRIIIEKYGKYKVKK